MIKIQLLKKIFALSFLFILALGMMQPVSVLAQSYEIEASIPVSVAVKDKNDTIVDRKDVKTEFKLRPLDGAPMPSTDTLVIEGNGKASFDSIHFTEPGVYYYELSAKLAQGENASMTDSRNLIVRIFVENSKHQSSLTSRVDAYNKEYQNQAQNQDVPKDGANFTVLYSVPEAGKDSDKKDEPESTKKPDLVDTSASFDAWLYVMLLGAGIVLSLGLGFIARKENR